MLTLQTHLRARRRVTALVGLAHAALLILDCFGRLNFTVDSRYDLLEASAKQPAWLLLHAAVAAVLWYSVWRKHWYIHALGISVGVMGSWSVLTLLWGVSTVRPVSLVGPVFGLIVTAIAYVLAGAWAVGGEDHEAVG